MEVLTEGLHWPLFVKPVDLGSSIGISRVTGAGGMPAAVELARRYSRQVIVEQGVAGGEYFAGILGRTVLPLIRIETPARLLRLRRPSTKVATRGITAPAGWTRSWNRTCSELSLRAFDALGCQRLGPGGLHP